MITWMNTFWWDQWVTTNLPAHGTRLHNTGYGCGLCHLFLSDGCVHCKLLSAQADPGLPSVKLTAYVNTLLGPEAMEGQQVAEWGLNESL